MLKKIFNFFSNISSSSRCDFWRSCFFWKYWKFQKKWKNEILKLKIFKKNQKSKKSQHIFWKNVFPKIIFWKNIFPKNMLIFFGFLNIFWKSSKKSKFSKFIFSFFWNFLNFQKKMISRNRTSMMKKYLKKKLKIFFRIYLPII